ncbi:MAG TPA: hypothetical protein VK456_17430 [Xanthobacteraceae bacterium]|nr:hypothetical protein [Xanthobacteraceae bacterium]
MQHNVIAVRTWSHEFETATASASPESVILFSLLGLSASAVALLTYSAESIAAIAAALMPM